ncbi:hypothetical protein JCM8547_008683 [Rhodosporidiobolus lusitaniae]
MDYELDSSTQDPHRPSLFELAAQDQLRDLLSPVVRYILSVFAQRHPRYLLRLVNHHDLLFSIAMYFVEKHYLVVHGGSFAETFYGLKRRRVRVGGGAGGENVRKAAELTGKSDRMGRREVQGSLVFLILLPYLKTKMADLYERLGGGVDESLFSSTSSSSTSTTPLSFLRNPSLPLRSRLIPALEAAFKLSYPYANLAYELYLLVYNLRYLFGKSPYWRPWFRLVGIEVRRMGQEDYQRLADLPSTLSLLLVPPPNSPRTTRPPIRLVLSRLLRLSPSLALDSLKTLLPLTIFFFRLLEWWYSPSGGSSRFRSGGGGGKAVQPALRAPPPPLSVKRAVAEVEYEKDKLKRGGCVVHSQERDGPVENPTALPSGWVGCYRCLRGLEEEAVVLPGGEEVSVEEWEEREKEEGKELERRKTGRLRDPKTGEWVEMSRLRRIMG